MPLGWALARQAGGTDPGAMLAAADAGAAAAVLIVLATVTTNFVNIYLSSLAWRSVMPAVPERAAVWIVGLVGTALGAASGAWLDRFAGFMTVVGSVLVPVGGVLVAHFVVRRAGRTCPTSTPRADRWPACAGRDGGVGRRRRHLRRVRRHRRDGAGIRGRGGGLSGARAPEALGSVKSAALGRATLGS